MFKSHPKGLVAAALSNMGATNLAPIVRRDIVQGIITYYFLNVLNDGKSLAEWRSKGGLA